VLAQGIDGDRRNLQGAPAASRLRVAELEPGNIVLGIAAALGSVQGTEDRQFAVIEIEVGSLQPEQFALAHAGGDCEGVESLVAVATNGVQERAEFVGLRKRAFESSLTWWRLAARIPPYPVLAESQRRSLLREHAEGQNQQQPSSVYQDKVRGMMARMPPPGPSGPPGMTPGSAGPPNSAMGLPGLRRTCLCRRRSH
jgi:hypothetical protein